jgi:DNA topoisomerase I
VGRTMPTTPCAELAEADWRDLVHTNDGDPGIRRTGRSRFRYIDEQTGRTVRDRDTLDRIAALAVPPAWQDVWICATGFGHLQATGRDARGRKQYRYHPAFRARRETEKFSDLVPFGEALGDVRTAIDRDLELSGWTQERATALVLALLDRTHLRVGNERYAGENRTFGLTTLRGRHLVAGDGELQLRFRGKGGAQIESTIGDRRLAGMVRRCSQLPGQLLFQWRDDDGELRPVRSSDVNERLREISGLDISAKSFRTWGASLKAATLLADADPPSSQREATRTVLEAVDEVADHLGNTRAVCRASYVHPAVPAAYESGRLPDWWRDGPSRSAKGLSAEERRLLAVLRRARRAGLGARPASRRAA